MSTGPNDKATSKPRAVEAQYQNLINNSEMSGTVTVSVTGACSAAVSRLCSVVDDCLRQLTVSESVALTLTPDKERHLLITLSQLLNEIRRWTSELEGEEQGQGSCNSHSGECECLSNVVANLMLLLSVKSLYVQHLVINIFMVISEFLIGYGSNWDNFIHLLCICFEFALCNKVTYSIQPSMSGVENSKSIVSNLNLVKSKLKNSTWNTMAGITGILRGIIKLLKGEDDQLVGVLWNSLRTALLKAPLDVLNRVRNNSSTNDGTCSGKATSFLINAGETEVKILFLGNLVQLLCSLIGITGLEEARTGSHNKFSILHEICELVPKLLHWCFAEEWSYRSWNILPYFQHKILLLMIRLSFCMQLDCSVLVRWLELLHKYYKDLLTRPISQLEYGEDDNFEGSPFLLSLYDKKVHPLSSCHLQRQAVFLFIRCSLSLIIPGDVKCGCMSPNSYCASELNTIRDCCAEKKGLLEFSGWLQSHVPSIMFSDDEMYLEKCIKFASSFIKLYISEDDMLFEVLLQMFSIPSWAQRLFLEERRICQDAEKDTLFHISNFFNPILLFHLFLAELQYDHQLLLDYLISRDTGSKCAEYLLRCLRTVCNSWTLFIEFSAKEHVYQKSCKRRRAFCEDSYEGQSANPLQNGLAVSSEQHPEEQELKNKFSKNRSIQLEDATACLLSLKSSLEKLHRRKLFPYNPEVLLRRLTTFEELCNQHV